MSCSQVVRTEGAMMSCLWLVVLEGRALQLKMFRPCTLP